MEQPSTAVPLPPVTTNGHAPRAIERATRHFHTIGRQRREVPEWPDEAGCPLEVFFNPITTADLETTAAQARTPREQTIYMLIHKLRDEQGQQLFDYRDKLPLMHEVAWTVVRDLIDALYDTIQLKTLDEAKQILGDDKAREFRQYLADRLSVSLETVEGWPVDHLTLWAAYCHLHPTKAGVPEV